MEITALEALREHRRPTSLQRWKRLALKLFSAPPLKTGRRWKLQKAREAPTAAPDKTDRQLEKTPSAPSADRDARQLRHRPKSASRASARA